MEAKLLKEYFDTLILKIPNKNFKTYLSTLITELL